MDQKTATDYINACMKVRRFTSMMPELAAGMSPKHVLTLKAIYELSQSADTVSVSDVAECMETTRPSVTKLLQYLEKIGAVEKVRSGEDKRMYTVALTELGREYHEEYGVRYHQHLRALFEGIQQEDMETATRVMLRTYEILKEDKHGI